MLELEAEGAKFEDFANSGRSPILDRAISSGIGRCTIDAAIGHDIRQKVEDMRNLQPPVPMKGRQKVFMVYKSYRIDESRGFMYSYADLQAVKLRGGEPDLERFHKHWLSVCSKLSKPVEEHIRQTLYYDNVKALPILKETMYHYDLAEEGSSGKTLKVLTDAVEKIIDKKVRDSN